MKTRTIISEYPTPEEWSEIFDSLDIKKRIKEAVNVAIKVNFASGTAAGRDSHIITDLNKISNVIKAIAAINEKAFFYIVEADSTNDGFAYLKFEHLEIPNSLNLPKELLERTNTVDMSRDRLKYIYMKEFKYFDEDERKLWLSETYMNADFVISLANLKTHSVTGYTGACKNLFGCLPAFDKSGYHIKIHQVIHDLVLAKTPDLSIVDGFYAMEKNGPVSGNKVNLGFMIVSNNPYAADVVASAQVGLQYSNIKYLKFLSAKYGEYHLQLEMPIRKIKKPELFLRVFNRIGIGIQRIGECISRFGHHIHIANNPIILAKVIMRPIVVKIIGIDRLKAYKERTFK